MSTRSVVTIAAVAAVVLGTDCAEPTTPPSAPVHRIVVSPQRGAILPGATLQLTATLFDSAGRTVHGGPVVWATFDSAVATVSAEGEVLGVALGTTTIRGHVERDTAAAIIDVVAPIDSIVVLPNDLILAGPYGLQVILLDAAGGTIRGRPVVWSSSDTTIATVSAAGVVSGRRPGSVTVAARSENVVGRATFTIRTPRYASAIPGYGHSCGIGTDSAAYCWGARFGGAFALGAGSPVSSTAPVGVTGGLRFRAIAAGDDYSCGLVSDGRAYCWGDGAAFRLGNGGTADTARPVAVSGALAFTTLAAGGAHTCGLTAGGAAHCWGAGGAGALGDEDSTDNAVPTPVAGEQTFVAIAAGTTHTCALTAAGAAFCWGDDSWGQVGDSIPPPTTTIRRTVPAPVAGGLAFRAIAAGLRHSCGITVGGAAFCWGEDYRGQLGSSQPNALCGSPLPQYAIPCVTYPVPVDGGLAFATITAGGRKTCALGAGGSAYCWGEGAYGQLGNGDTLSTAAPTAVTGGLSFVAISAGPYHTCGLTTAAVAYCWGVGSGGAIGSGELVVSNPSPTRVAGQP